ncbi:hypothetical protein KAK07_19915 [Ideonella sp. 4Y16]|uniref:Uncharacterized protein n=1 Tax=Ideonella alba TaxID=2824118 RepID=A0A941BGH5_9BURK|nr:hypothetical protein [Ideonella alba]MBQ0932102.1 hypothetical protein [Ideonella alba]MBQ0945616.1 hypothetical protein [Ideonella alba]
MNTSTASALTALQTAVTQARLETLGPRRDPRAAVPAATHRPPTPSPAAQNAEALGRQLEQEMQSERRALERLQASLKSLPRHDPVLGSLLDVSA